MKKIKQFFALILQQTNKPWYPALVAFLAGIDLFIAVVPTDAFTISAVYGQPRRWLSIAFTIAVGSLVGAFLLASLIAWDAPWIQQSFPAIFASPHWAKATHWIDEYGIWGIALGSIGPLPLQPFIIIPALAGLPLSKILGAYALSRSLKLLLLCWVASHSPKLIGRLWGFDKKIPRVCLDSRFPYRCPVHRTRLK